MIKSRLPIIVAYAPDQVTIEAWVKPSRTDWQTIWMKGTYGYGLALTGSSTSCQSSLKQLWIRLHVLLLFYNGTYINNEWNHVALTVIDNGSNLTVYFTLMELRMFHTLVVKQQ